MEKILDLIDKELFSMSENNKIKILATILYPHESYYSLTVTQLDKVKEILNKFK